MSELTDFRDHARARADWQPSPGLRAACRDRTEFGTPKRPDHANCGGDRCGCDCHRPTDRERVMWQRLADEIDNYLNPTPAGDEPSLFDQELL